MIGVPHGQNRTRGVWFQWPRQTTQSPNPNPKSSRHNILQFKSAIPTMSSRFLSWEARFSRYIEVEVLWFLTKDFATTHCHLVFHIMWSGMPLSLLLGRAGNLKLWGGEQCKTLPNATDDFVYKGMLGPSSDRLFYTYYVLDTCFELLIFFSTPSHLFYLF